MSSPTEGDLLRGFRAAGCLVLLLTTFWLCLVPFLFVNLLTEALRNLHLSAPAAVLIIFGLLIGSLINIPVARLPTDREVTVPVFEPLAGRQLFPRYTRLKMETIVAVNVGGCVIPVLLATHMLRMIVADASTALGVTLIGVLLNSTLCYRLARIIPQHGIALPFFVAPLTAITATYIGLPGPEFDEMRAPVAFVIGITGPLIGADLLHWKDFHKISVGRVSIGGAGTWDGIVLSGLIAAFCT